MPYQIPKANHPWRQYRDKEATPEEKKKARNIKTLKVFIQEIAQNWDGVKVVTSSYGRYGEFTLNELSQEKQAAWLAGILKRNYVQY